MKWLCVSELQDVTLVSDALPDQILGAWPARSNTGTFSTSSDASADGVSSAACRNASVSAFRPSTVSLAWLPGSCGRVGTLPSFLTGFCCAIACLPAGQDINEPGRGPFRS